MPYHNKGRCLKAPNNSMHRYTNLRNLFFQIKYQSTVVQIVIQKLILSWTMTYFILKWFMMSVETANAPKNYSHLKAKDVLYPVLVVQYKVKLQCTQLFEKKNSEWKNLLLNVDLCASVWALESSNHQQAISPSLTCEVARLYLSQRSSRLISSLGGVIMLLQLFEVYKHQEKDHTTHPCSKYWKTGRNIFSKPTRCLWLDQTAKAACLPGRATTAYYIAAAACNHKKLNQWINDQENLRMQERDSKR